MTANTLEQRARELLAAEYERDGRHDDALALRDGLSCNAWSIALRAIKAALRLSAGADAVERLDESEKDIALGQAVELAEYVERQAKGTMRDAAKRFLSLSYSQTIAARLSAGADWQPIETAPHDRPCIVTNGVAVGEANWFKDDDGWWWAQTDPTDAHDGRVYEPTHWQPLPATPRHEPGEE